jgi:hypothetical protein
VVNINQYTQELDGVLSNYLSINTYHFPALPLYPLLTTNPVYATALTATYGLSITELRESVYRIGIGSKLSEIDSDIFEQYEGLIDKPEVGDLGILCPKGILTFYEDVLYRRSRDVRLLAASYHFQTAPQTAKHPLYVRFEFDPILPGPAKPVFHYHFSNYDWFHKSCHFPAGHFEVSNRYPFSNEKIRQIFIPPAAPNLESFVQLLLDAGLIARD